MTQLQSFLSRNQSNQNGVQQTLTEQKQDEQSVKTLVFLGPTSNSQMLWKHSPNNDHDLKEFLRLVAEGEQDKAEAMLKSNPNLALVPGDIRDLSKRIFTNITGFQYSVWALDWHMWTMIRKYLSTEEAQFQAQGFEMGSWVKTHGVHAEWLLDNLMKAYKTTITLFEQSKYNEGDKTWVQQVGRAQLLLPAHVINEYCHPTRPFDPCPNFKDSLVLPRSRKIDEGEWFTAERYGGKLGEKFSVCRGAGVVAEGSRGAACAGIRVAGSIGGSGRSDHVSIRALTSSRTAQREELIADLSPRQRSEEGHLTFIRLQQSSS